MSKSSTIKKEDMRGFLKYFEGERKLVGPVDTGKVIEFREASSNDILMDDRVSYKSLKEYYFPQTELMFTFKDGEVTDNTDIPGFVIFGARPCDLEALRVMSVVYTTGKYADPFFQRRFEKNLLIGVGCLEQKPECFCRDMEIDKEFSDFCDIMLFDNGDSYSVGHLSEKGKKALEEYLSANDKDSSVAELLQNDTNGIFSVSSEESSKSRNDSSVKPLSPIKLNTNKEDSVYFDIIDWEKTTETCKGCGICTYICPTCYCFDFKDVSKKGEATRYKCWDSCMYPKFTLHASGHNPRENRYERYRQRVLHKYKYVPENFDGYVACTGCGRCVRSCPVGINIKSIVTQVKEAEE